MIKVYAVGFKLENGITKYMTNKSRLGIYHRRGSMIYDTTTDISDAKHYETHGRAKGVCKSFSRKISEYINNFTIILNNLKKNNMSGWENAKYEKKLEATKIISLTLGIPQIFEHEVDSKDETNIKAVVNKRLSWVIPYRGGIYKSNGFEIKTETGSRHYCKNCGLKLKNIPQVNLKCIYGGVLCARCAISMGEEAKRAWELIPKEEREAIESEIFVHNLG